jgi:hypothetical protein
MPFMASHGFPFEIVDAPPDPDAVKRLPAAFMHCRGSGKLALLAFGGDEIKNEVGDHLLIRLPRNLKELSRKDWNSGANGAVL